MDRFSKLVSVSAFIALQTTSACAFVFPDPPPGFGGTPGNWTFAPPPGSKQIDKIIHQSKAMELNIPGAGRVSMPVSYKLGPNAAKVAARAIFLHPGVRTAAGIATWLGLAKIFWDEAEKVWKQIPEGTSEQSDGYEYYMTGTGYHTAPIGACTEYVGLVSGRENPRVEPVGSGWRCVYRTFWIDSQGKKNIINENSAQSISIRPSSCPAGWYKTPAGCVQQPQPITVSPEQFEETLPGHPMPQTVPGELPQPTPLPITEPSPWINPDPGTNPQHRPKFVPTGDPVPNPQYDPNAQPSEQNKPFVQPGVRINPSPTMDQPFRLDVKPVDKPQATPDPLPEQNENPGENNAKPQENPGLCDQYPDILACQKFDNPDDSDLPTKEKDISITPDAGWGSETASCPAAKQITVQGRNIPIPFDLFCTYMNGMRPIILAMAWLSAAFILLGARESS